MKKISFLYILLFSIVFGCIPNSVHAQEEGETDSLPKQNDTITAKYFYEKDMRITFDIRYTMADTNLTGFQIFNPLLKKNPFARVNGNIGQAYQSMVFDVNAPQTYNNVHLGLDNYLVTNDQVRYFETKQAFSEIEYVNGTKKENFFHILHSQNIRKNANITLQFDVINSLGSYVRSLSNHRNLVISSNYLSKNKRYGYLAHLVYNKIHNQEWGGLADVLNAPENLQLNKSLDARLTSTDNSVVARRLYLTQFLNLGRVVESCVNDTMLQEDFVAGSRLSHTCSYQDKSYLFTDDNTDNQQYEHHYITANFTKDSTHIKKLENELKWLYTGAHSSINLLKNSVGIFSLSHDLNRVVQHNNDTVVIQNMDTIFHNIKTSFYVGSNEKKAFQWNASVCYTLWGYNKGNYEAKTEARKYFGDRENEFYVGARLLFFEKNREYNTNQYASNHYVWRLMSNSFQVAQYSADFGFKKFKIVIDYAHFRKYLFWTSYGKPIQSTKSFDIYFFNISRNFNYKFIHLDNNIVVQTSSKPELYDIPLVATSNSLYFNFRLYKKVLLLSAGIDVLFNTAYYAPEYLPSLGVYYPVTAQKIGNYPYIDVFLNAKLKRAKFFVKLEHTNAKLMGYGYFATPSQPMAARTFKLGILWDMLY